MIVLPHPNPCFALGSRQRLAMENTLRWPTDKEREERERERERGGVELYFGTGNLNLIR